MNLNNRLWEEIEWLFDLTQRLETSHPLALGVKLSEEVGEFSEALLKATGHLAHKEVKESPVQEAADVINVLIGCLSLLYPDKSPRELTEELYNAMCDKGEKYERILREQDVRS